MVVDPRRNLDRPSGIALAICLLSIWTVRSESSDIRPSEHGLLYEKDPGAASPPMAAFFRGRPEAALPEARNSTDPVWGVAGRVEPDRSGHVDGHDRTRTVLLIAGVVFGVVGVGLLGAAATAYVVHSQRSKAGRGVGLGVSLPHRRSGAEVRLGAA